MTANQRLYNELRKFVDKDKVREYDNEFFSQKNLNPLIYNLLSLCFYTKYPMKYCVGNLPY